MIADKKYELAFKILDKFDPKNGRPEIVLLKEKIALNYFVSTIMHQVFALKDLNKGEEIMDYRGKAGSFGMQLFDIDKILDSLIKIYPNNCKLYNGLGEFYYEVHLKYGDNWLKKEDELYKLIGANFTKVINGGCVNYLSYYYLGEISTEQKKYNEAIHYFLKAIEMYKGYASSYYNLAYAYLYINDRENALKNAKIALDLYTDQSYKSVFQFRTNEPTNL